VKAITRLPIIVDASHGTGRRDLVPALTLSGVAAGADGILVEVHPDPERSLSDADQAIHPTTFDELMRKTRVVRAAIKAEEY
jgi:3-deoxy-7-phosphoheptulonate synthase